MTSHRPRSAAIYHPLPLCLFPSWDQVFDVLPDHRVAKGTPFYISTYAIHNDPRVWGESVATFLPERWLTPDSDAAKKAKSSFFGFGDGPRVCPGSRFALTEAKMALVRILQKFTLELQPGQVGFPFHMDGGQEQS